MLVTDVAAVARSLETWRVSLSDQLIALDNTIFFIQYIVQYGMVG